MKVKDYNGVSWLLLSVVENLGEENYELRAFKFAFQCLGRNQEALRPPRRKPLSPVASWLRFLSVKSKV